LFPSSFYVPLPACPLLRIPFFTLAHTDFEAQLRTTTCALQIRREWIAQTDSQGIQQAELESSRELCVQILEGLDYLHRSDVVHCDLKAGNILTTKTGNVELSDFGVSLNLRAMVLEIKDVAGTPNWMTPEVIRSKRIDQVGFMVARMCNYRVAAGTPSLSGMQTSLKYANLPLSKPPLANVRFPLPWLDLSADRFCSRQLSRMQGEGCRTVSALQPHRTLQVRQLGGSNLRPALETAHTRAVRGARQQREGELLSR
jgi:hypothetical protein